MSPESYSQERFMFMSPSESSSGSGSGPSQSPEKTTRRKKHSGAKSPDQPVEYFNAEKYRLAKSKLKTFQTEVSFRGKKYSFSFDAHDPIEARDKARMHLVAEVTGVPDSVKEEMYTLSDENITVVEKDDKFSKT